MMRIIFDLPTDSIAEVIAEVLVARSALVESMARLNEKLIATEDVQEALLQLSFVKLQDDASNDDVVIHDVRKVLSRGHGTIEELVALRVALLRLLGCDAYVRHLAKPLKDGSLWVTAEVVLKGTGELDCWLESVRDNAQQARDAIRMKECSHE